MARGKELSNSQKTLIVKLWKDGESYRNISSNPNNPFTTITSFIARFKRLNTVENKKKTGAPGKVSPRLSRKLGRLINQNSMVTREELPENLGSSGCSVTKRTRSNEMQRNCLKSRRPKKTPLLLKRHRGARLKFLRQHKEKEDSFRKEYYGQMKPKLSCLIIFIEIMCGGKMVKPTHQRIWYCQIWRWQYNDLGMFFSERCGQNMSNRQKNECPKV